jgi:prepilin-type N-terminal cleavage/methylation domain-containing protein
MTRTRRSEGFTLVELLLVVVLFGLVITVIFTVVGALSTITASSSEQSNMARDLSYQLEILSKTIMQGKVIYANDDVVFLRQRVGAGYNMVKVHVDTVTNNGVVTGRLVVRRWSTNAAGTAPSGGMDRTWIVSDLNGNLLTTPPTPLFTGTRISWSPRTSRR